MSSFALRLLGWESMCVELIISCFLAIRSVCWRMWKRKWFGLKTLRDSFFTLDLRIDARSIGTDLERYVSHYLRCNSFSVTVLLQFKWQACNGRGDVTGAVPDATAVLFSFPLWWRLQRCVILGLLLLLLFSVLFWRYFLCTQQIF